MPLAASRPARLAIALQCLSNTTMSQWTIAMVNARAQAKASDLTQRAKDATSQVRRQAGSAREQLADSYQTSGPLKRAVTQGIDGARTYRKPLIIAVGVLIAGAVAVRIWTRR